MIGHERIAARRGRYRGCLLSVVIGSLLAACGGAPIPVSPSTDATSVSPLLTSTAVPLPTATSAVAPLPSPSPILLRPTPLPATPTRVILPATATAFALAATAAAATVSHAPQQFFLNLDVNLAGRPQIPPRMPITDPNTPTFPPQDVERYVLTHSMQGTEKIGIAPEPGARLEGITLTTVATYNARHADVPLALAGDYLVYIATFRGTYSVAGGAYSPGPRPTFNTAIWVIHAQLGVILAEGIVNQ